MVKTSLLILILITSFLVTSCQKKEEVKMSVDEKVFGKLEDGSEVKIFTIQNKNGVSAQIINYGAIVVSLKVPDKKGNLENVVLGYDNLEGYVNDKSFIGATVGRYGNRIAKGKFSIGGVEYQLTQNDGNNHLHGGSKGFYKALWKGKTDLTEEGPKVILSYSSPDGEEGYPGNVKIQLIYTLTEKNELKIEYTATTDKPTIMNPTHHSYFNLSGDFTKSILNQELFIDADIYTPIDSESITTGELAPVENTPMDFRKPTKIGDRINEDNEQLKNGRGYDHNWVINNVEGKVKLDASVYEPGSGRFMEVLSDEPGIQFYSGNFLDGTITGKGRIKYQYRTAICLENQHYPDSPNKVNFPPVVLRPGEVYSQTSIYRFLVK
jgi:aldose 1-epimerase